jgi:hypothetical protein
MPLDTAENGCSRVGLKSIRELRGFIGVKESTSSGEDVFALDQITGVSPIAKCNVRASIRRAGCERNVDAWVLKVLLRCHMSDGGQYDRT